jgi:Holliday junction resolvasome RuvABC endonuclease subunit
MINIQCKLIAIDSSTNKSGVAIFEDGIYIKNHLLDFSNDKSMETRFCSMAKSLINTLSHYKPDIVYVEETVVVRNAQVQRFLTRLQGVIYGWCIMNDCEFNTIRPTEFRKQLDFKQGKNVKRDELKQQAMDYVKLNYNLEVNDDVADAICVGCAVINKFKKSK